MTTTTVATVATLQSANEWLATRLRGTDQIGGLYPTRWSRTYHEQFRAAIDAGALLLAGTHNPRRLANAICDHPEATEFRSFDDNYRNDLGRWLDEHYREYLVRAFPLGTRWTVATAGADFSGFRPGWTLQRTRYTEDMPNGVDVSGRVYFQRVGDDDTPVGGTQFLYPASIRPLEATTVGFPTPPQSFTEYHLSAINAAQEWVGNGVNDVATGVDAQMVAWSMWWPNDSCGADAAAKDYASALMEHKCGLLGIPFPVVGPVRESVDPDRASLDWDRATPLTPGETLPAMTVLLMAANPRTSGGGGVYFGNTEPILVHLVNEHTVSPDRDSSPSVRRVDGQVTEHGSMTQVVGEAYLRHPAPLPVTEPTPEPEPTVSEEDRLRARLREAEERHRTDIQMIGETLMREANRRNWCSEYDEIVDGINSRISVELPLRRREHEVVISGYVRVPFSYSMTVEAEDSDDAYEMASETWSDQVSAGDLLRNYTDSYDAEIEDDYDVEVQ